MSPPKSYEVAQESGVAKDQIKVNFFQQSIYKPSLVSIAERVFLCENHVYNAISSTTALTNSFCDS